jgi:hypothetical protein
MCASRRQCRPQRTVPAERRGAGKGPRSETAAARGPARNAETPDFNVSVSNVVVYDTLAEFVEAHPDQNEVGAAVAEKFGKEWIEEID